MSEQIKLDAARLSDIAVQIKQVSSRLEDVENKISQALEALDWEVRSKEDIEGNINDIKNNLVRQRENLNAMTGVIERASDKTNEINADLTRVALSIVTAVLASVSVFNPIGKIGVISYLTGVKDWLTNVTGGGESGSNIGVNVLGTSALGGEGNSVVKDSVSTWGDTNGEELKSAIERRDSSFLKKTDGSMNTEILNVGKKNVPALIEETDSKTGMLTGRKKVNCVWLTQQKIKYITGQTRKMEELRAVEGTGFDVNGVHFNVNDMKKLGDSVDSIIKNVKQPAENIILSWSGHQMIIDKIIDNKVYFTDNSNKSWDYFLSNGVLKVEVKDLDEFIKYYKVNGNPEDAFQITR